MTTADEAHEQTYRTIVGPRTVRYCTGCGDGLDTVATPSRNAKLRLLLPIGRDRLVIFKVAGMTGTHEWHVTVQEHEPDAVIVGMHPNLYRVLFEDIVDVRTVNGGRVKGSETWGQLA